MIAHQLYYLLYNFQYQHQLFPLYLIVLYLMSLQQVLKNYEGKKRQREKTAQSLRQQIEKGIEEASIQALKLQNHKVNHIHKNQQAIETRLRKQQELLADLRKNEQVWSSLYQQLNRALMQVGDLVHYAGYVQAEVGEMVGVGTVAKYLQDAENAVSVHEEEKPSIADKNEQKTQVISVVAERQEHPKWQQSSFDIIL